MSNTYPLGGKRAFTLIEMLVVVAIISVVATASVNSIKSAHRQARSVKCQANMHALYNAAAAYHADKGYWPSAGAYEYYDGHSDVYYQFRGWVNWVLDSGGRSRQGDTGNKYKGSGNSDVGQKKSQAQSYVYVGVGYNADDYKGATAGSGSYREVNKSRIYRSIDEGSLFVYTDKNFSIYCCDEYKNHFPDDKKSGVLCLRSYAMNQRFCSRRKREGRLEDDVPSDNPDRMAMFVEMGELPQASGEKAIPYSGTAGTGKKGTSGDAKTPTDVFADDCVWDWDGSGGKNDGDGGEDFGAMHRKSGKPYGHVVFADGHLESLALPKRTDKTTRQQLRRQLGMGELRDKNDK